MSIRTCMFYSYVNGLIFLHYTNHILSIYFVIGTCQIWTNSTSPLWRSLEGTTSSGFKMWSSTSLQRTCVLLLKKQQINLLAKLKKAIAMIFIQRHIHDALQTKYSAEEDPHALWVALADRFDHQKDIFLPEARHD